MICPYCDSRIENLPSNHVCPQCGAPLAGYIEQKKENKKLVFPEPPMGVYSYGRGYMELEEKRVRFYRKDSFEKKVDRYVPYDEIIGVSFVQQRGLTPGVVCVRSQQDRHKPLAKSYSEARDDETSAFIPITEKEEFYQAYLFLKQCADIVNAAEE